MKLNRSFFSLYFLVITTFIVFSWLLDEVWNSYLEQDIESYTGYKTMMTAVGDYIKKHPEHEWDDLIVNTGKRYNLSLGLRALSDVENIDHSMEKHLEQGNTHVYYYDDKAVIHQILTGTDKTLTLGPVKMPTRPRMEALIRVGILATFGLIIFIWLWPVSRDLDQLKKAAKRFGDGDFNTTAPLAKSNMMFGMVKSFNMMAARIKRLIDAHKELSSAVSHELRTPLARSKFALQMLENTSDAEKKSKYIKQITGDISELEELINEMLLYASFDSDKPELLFESTSIVEVINRQVDSHNQFEGTIDWQYPNNITQDTKVECDPHFIDRALNNFISNAVKYGAGKVKVTLSVVNQQCEICIEDNGEGVSDDFKKVIFDAFSRGDNSRNRETGGFGLGLAIVARIMEWHQGEARIQDSHLGGAAFILSWPIKQN
jgi:two-component system OmpR family sensor kinase